MPGWYNKIKSHLDTGNLNAIGIIQEQHGERTKLFNQWKRMEKMRLVFDSLNRLDVSAVPIVLFIDEHGIIRNRNPKPKDIDEFLATEFPSNANAPTIEFPVRSGDDSAIAGDFDSAITEYKAYLKANPTDARATFRLGVCYRKRFDAATVSSAGDPSDFSQAIGQWQAALKLNPNQYIWRRRLQQYGPVLSKPYPFYDWVRRARSEIMARGETPITLRAEPAGAELVGPRQSTESLNSTGAVEPDPTGNVNRDSNGAITIQSAIVHSTEQKKTARIHLLLRPSGVTEFQWNNEVEPVRIWWDSNRQITPSKQLIEIAPSQEHASQPTSGELRSTEFEVSWKDDDKNDAAASRNLNGYAVYHLCNKSTGSCAFFRQDIVIQVVPAR